MFKAVLTFVLAGLLLGGFAFSPFAKNFSANAQEQPTGTMKHVTLIADEMELPVAPDNALHPGGITYKAQVFNGTIPSPIIAVDQGDQLNITVINEGQAIHSVDFHAGQGPQHVVSGNVEPGQSKSFVLNADTPGFFLYHCGADGLNGVWQHIADGMYGGIVVHPQNEKPAKEFYLSFGEIYNTADKGPFVGTNGTVGSFDIAKFITGNPDLVLTNGMAHKYVPAIGEKVILDLNKNASVFKVKPGEPTRWYILNPGPNDGVAFHFISGMITVRDGTINNDFGVQDVNDETWWIPPGSGSVIEATFPTNGTYVGVDHAMNDVVKGAAFAVVADESSTPNDHPEGTAVAPKGSESVVATNATATQ